MFAKKIAKKPKYLYHGSPTKIKFLEPRPGRGLGPYSDDRKIAVFATDDKLTACVFALSPVPDKDGHCHWGFNSTKKGKINVYIQKGILNPTGRGYLYYLPSKTFRKSYGHQWLSKECVMPVKCDLVKRKKIKNEIFFEFK